MKTDSNLILKFIDSPLGTMVAASNDVGVCLLEFLDDDSIENYVNKASKYFKTNTVIGDNEVLINLERELAEYFAQKRKTFSVPIDLIGTNFQKSVWETLRKISYGETWSYSQQADFLGDRKKVRAVANANSRNRISIIIPCHRVIGNNGSLTGYAGGLWRKQKLLELEGRILF